jgi:hypothetical protein
VPAVKEVDVVDEGLKKALDRMKQQDSCPEARGYEMGREVKS